MSNNFPVKIKINVNVLSHLDMFDHYTFQEVLESGVVSKKDGRILRPFYLIEEDRTCNDEFGYLGWGDSLPSTYSVEFDLAEVKRQVQSVEQYNRDPESRETIYLSVTRVIPRPLQKRNTGRIIHKEF
jgi:hypothetical protein